MRLRFAILLAAGWLAVFAGSDSGTAQTIHAVLVGHTSDPSIGPGVTENKANITSFLRNVNTLTGLDVKTTEVDGTNFSCKAIIEAISNLNVAADDAVFFYYAGHGFRRDSSQTQFPEFWCSGPGQETQTLSQAVGSIKAKRPRLVVAIADACNDPSPGPPVPPKSPVLSADRKGGLLRLFKDYRGTLIMAGAIPGQSSWYAVAGPLLGGFFTNQLLDAINDNITESGANVRWEKIAADASKPISVPKSPPVIQNPQYLAVGLSVGSVIAPAGSIADVDDSLDDINPADLRRLWVGDIPIQAAALPYVLTSQELSKFPGSFGLDLSHYTFDIDPRRDICKTQQGYTTAACSCVANWQTVQNAGVRYVYSKASDGSSVDLSFAKFWTELKAKHEAKVMFRGAYHFLRPGVDPDAQADAFLRAVGATNQQKPAQLSPVLDIEWANRVVVPGTPAYDACPDNRRTSRRTAAGQIQYICDMWSQVPSATIAAMAKKWIDRVEAATGMRVTIYTNPTAWWNPVMGAAGDDLLRNRAVWTSRYTSSGPQYNETWSRQNGSEHWKMAPLPRGASYPPPGRYSIPHFWQFTESGFLPANFLTCNGRSVQKAVDMNFIPVSANNYPVPFGVQQ